MTHANVPDGSEEDVEDLFRDSLRPRAKPTALDTAFQRYFQPTDDRNIGGGRRIVNPTASEWTAVVQRLLADFGMPAGGVFSGKSGWDALAALRDELHQQSAAVAGSRSRAVWLAIIRRLDVDILSVYSDGVRHALRDNLYRLTQRATRPVREREFEVTLSTPTQSLLGTVGDLVTVASICKSVDSALLRVGKDQPVHLAVENGAVYPTWETTTEVEAAIALHDARIEAGGGTPDRLGASGALVGHEWTDQSAIVWTSLLDQHVVRPELRDRLRLGADPYFPVLGQLDKHLPALRFLNAPDLTVSLAGAALLEVGWRYLKGIGAAGRLMRGDWSRAGYMLLPQKKMERLWREVIDSSSRYAPINDWPFDHVVNDNVGPALLPVGHKILLDLMGAGAMFLDSVERSKDGTPANIWGSTFETSVQQIIDSSSWRPEGRLRELVGRTVKYSGQAVTDIDGLADADGTIVIIDAKAHAASDAYLRGEWAGVRDFRRTIERESKAWTEKVTLLSGNRAMYGLEQLGQASLVPLVVVPFVPYLEIGPATREVIAGLRAVSSADELLRAVHKELQATRQQGSP